MLFLALVTAAAVATGSWTEGVYCTDGYISGEAGRAFLNKPSVSYEAGQAECAAACDANSDCEAANYYRSPTTNNASCYFRSACTGSSEYPNYAIYRPNREVVADWVELEDVNQYYNAGGCHAMTDAADKLNHCKQLCLNDDNCRFFEINYRTDECCIEYCKLGEDCLAQTNILDDPNVDDDWQAFAYTPRADQDYVKWTTSAQLYDFCSLDKWKCADCQGRYVEGFCQVSRAKMFKCKNFRKRRNRGWDITGICKVLPGCTEVTKDHKGGKTQTRCKGKVRFPRKE